MDENVQNTDSQSTTSDGQEQQQETAQVNTDATASQEHNGADEGTAQESAENDIGNGEGAEEPFLTVQFNHEDVNLSRDDALSYAQKGMKFGPLHDKLSYLASKSGTDVKGYINSLMNREEEEYRSQLEAKLGTEDNDIIDALMEKYRSDKNNEFKSFMAEQKEKLLKTNESRLADEFIELQKEITEFKDKNFSDLPDSVRKAAANGKNLTTAYLLYQRNQEKQIAEAQNKQKEVNTASAGSLSSSETVDTVNGEFLKGLWG